MLTFSISKFIKWIVVPIILIFIAIIFSIAYFFNSDINPKVYSYYHSSKSIQSNSGVIYGTFRARDNYLSLLTVRFENAGLIKSDSIFRIKNILDDDWYHSATISGQQYYFAPQYTFGLPPIVKSNGEIYLFEIRLKNNNPTPSGLILSNKFPVLISQYLYPKDLLIGNKRLMSQFIWKKLLQYIYFNSSLKVLVVYSIPFTLYIAYLVLENKLRNLAFRSDLKRKLLLFFKPYLLLIIIFITIDIFIIKQYSDYMTAIFTILWIIGAIVYKCESRHSFGIAIIFLMFCPFLLFASMDWIIEKSSIWALIFLIVGTVHAILELKFNKSKNMSKFINFISNTFLFIRYLDIFFLTCINRIKKFVSFSTRNLLLSIIICFFVLVLVLLGLDIYLKTTSYWNRRMKNPGTPKIEPTLVYPGTKVFLYGDRFGDGKSGKYALMRNGKKVKVDYWEDHKIIFTVPLDWTAGPIDLWIEKPVEWNAETVIERTKPKSIRLLKVTEHFTPDDNQYFEEMKYWNKETKEINGY